MSKSIKASESIKISSAPQQKMFSDIQFDEHTSSLNTSFQTFSKRKYSDLTLVSIPTRKTEAWKYSAST